jgi:hypothetical protein
VTADPLVAALRAAGWTLTPALLHGRGEVLSLTRGGQCWLLAVAGDSVELWPVPADPNGAPAAWARAVPADHPAVVRRLLDSLAAGPG